jgi:hypothetical protein
MPGWPAAGWRLLVPVALLLARCDAWDTPPHRKITKAALDALPTRVVERFGVYAAPLIETYCIYPDNYVEMEQYGFARKGGPRTAAEIKPYCVRPDGEPVHAISGNARSDTASLTFLFERIVTSFRQGRPDEAARYAGVLSHFIADSLSPPHAVTAQQLASLASRYFEVGNLNVHSAIERSIPDFTLPPRAAPPAGRVIDKIAQATLRACYAGADQNRKDLSAMVEAAAARNQPALDVFRLRAGTRAAEILADALYALAN